RITTSREISVVVVVIAVCIYMLFSKYRPEFYSSRNFQNMLRNVSMLAIFAIGETIVIISGGIDLSLGSLIAFTGMIVAFCVTNLGHHLIAGPAIALAIIITLIVATGIG